MCGICGFVSRNRITEDDLRAMNDTMTHRGPEDAGAELYDYGEGFTIGLAQRRLAIIDLTRGGHQPMHSADGSVSVVFNGEIYAYRDLKRELPAYPFRTSCDTEVLLAAYLEWGIDFVQHIHGMFAIALWDRRTGEFYLIRDRIGKKPLYYWLDGDNLIFGSELKPLMRCPGFRGEIRREILPRYLYQQYINAPESIFRDVYKLPPGSILRYRFGERSLRKYWDVLEAYERESARQVTDYAEAKAELKRLLQKATAERMVADVPVGVFLSGGYDSSLVTALAQSQSERPVRTFSIGFREDGYDEARYAKAVAAHLGTEHTELYIDEAEMFRLVESLPQYFDEPFADESEIPTMLVSKLAKEQVTVALSGDAGDEFFCGYNVYENVLQAQRLDPVGALVYQAGRLPAGGGKRLLDRMPFRVRVVAQNRDPETKVQFASESYIRAAHAFLSGIERADTPIGADEYLRLDMNREGTEIPCKYPMESRYKGIADWQVRRMLLDMDTYLPGDILCKVDRASMKYSLEARCPILDTAVMEYSFRIPQSFKFRSGDKKHILKDIAYDYIPKELLERPKKGFGAPMNKWLRGPLKEKLAYYAEEAFLKKQGIFDAAYTARFVGRYLETGDAGPASGANFSKLVLSFFVFQQWYEWMKGRNEGHG